MLNKDKPYPDDEIKQLFADKSALTLVQLNSWFKRKRLSEKKEKNSTTKSKHRQKQN